MGKFTKRRKGVEGAVMRIKGDSRCSGHSKLVVGGDGVYSGRVCGSVE